VAEKINGIYNNVIKQEGFKKEALHIWKNLPVGQPMGVRGGRRIGFRVYGGQETIHNK
jgi:hypothetical protein